MHLNLYRALTAALAFIAGAEAINLAGVSNTDIDGETDADSDQLMLLNNYDYADPVVLSPISYYRPCIRTCPLT